jgi:hypothetical protein
VGAMVAVHDVLLNACVSTLHVCLSFGITYVVPVALALLESAASEAESASPVTSRLGCVRRKWELTLVVVP